MVFLYVAVVIDTDGSAFITKAEFDSLKNNFQAQIDNYNSSIDSKIDGAIASYLSGIKLATVVEQETLFNRYVNYGTFYDGGLPGYIQFLKKDDTIKNNRTWSPFSLKVISLRVAVSDTTGKTIQKGSVWMYETQPRITDGVSYRYCVKDGKYLCFTTGYQSMFDYTVGGSRNNNGTGVLFMPFFQWSKVSTIADRWKKWNTNLWGFARESDYNIYFMYGNLKQTIDRYDINDITKTYGKKTSVVTPWKTNSGLPVGGKEQIANLSATDVYYHNGNTTSGTYFQIACSVEQSVAPYIKTTWVDSGDFSKDGSSLRIEMRVECGKDALSNGILEHTDSGSINYYSLKNQCFDGIFLDTDLMDYPADFAQNVDNANTKMSYGLKLFKSNYSGIANLNVTTKNKGYVIVYESDTGEDDWDGLKAQYLSGTIPPKFNYNVDETKDLEFNVTKDKTYWFVGVPDTDETIGIKINGCQITQDS